MIAERILLAFQPVIDLVQGLSYPVTFALLAISWGLIILGDKSRGMQMARTAVIGYILMQLLPGLMLVLRDVGRAMLVR